MYVAKVEGRFIFFKAKWGLIEVGTLRVTQHLNFVVESGNGDLVVCVVQRSDHLGEDVDRVGHGSAVNTRVQIAVRTRYFDFDVR